MAGLSALLRWNHPEWGLQTPDKFLSYLEDTGLIIPVGEWVFNQACKDTKQLVMEGKTNIRTSVNISPLQFKSHSLASRIAEIIKFHDLEPKYIEIEITESTLMDNMETATQILHEIKNSCKNL